jgi:GT2 family glycosyltransferase/glycosyltransferase involved in cell wall biosynthesis
MAPVVRFQTIRSWFSDFITRLRLSMAGQRAQAQAIAMLSRTPERITIASSDGPTVSVIVPIYGEIEYTLRCLASIALNPPDDEFEVIVIDDCSPDGSFATLSKVRGIQLLRNERNLGFIRSCNAAAGKAKGRYLYFLNNDTEVTPGWLDELLNTFKDVPRAGLVGSKLIYPDGFLQEAGGIIWQDGSAWNWGHRQDPRHCAYSYVRDADYVSGASIMIPATLFKELGMFQERYLPAYYEDTDLAMAVRRAGRRVIYQPYSRVIHCEGISSGTDLTQGTKRYQEINRIKFLETWADDLHHLTPNGFRPFVSCDRTRKRHILIVDAWTPTPDQDSGSLDMINLIKILVEQGWRVHFVPLKEFSHCGSYTDTLQRLGIECVYAPYYRTLNGYLRERGDIFEVCLLARTKVANRALPAVEKFCPSAKKIFYTVDLHFLREQREAEQQNNWRKLQRARSTERAELAIMDRVDCTVVLSEVERDLLARRGKNNLSIIPLIREVSAHVTTPVSVRFGILFVGGFQHQPNVDAVDWLTTEVWPKVRTILKKRGLPEVPLYIVGSKMPKRFEVPEFTDIKPVGFVPELNDAFEKVRLSIAPLRYGAGLKGKVASSFLKGIPVVGTAMAFEGMPSAGLEGVRLQADTAEDLARLVVDLHFSEERLMMIGDSCRRYAIEHYSSEATAPRVRALLQSLTGRA